MARDAQIMAAPATGEVERPIAPEICAKEPRSTMFMPKLAACGVMAPLKASAAASPEPLKIAIMNGPKLPAILAMD